MAETRATGSNREARLVSRALLMIGSAGGRQLLASVEDHPLSSAIVSFGLGRHEVRLASSLFISLSGTPSVPQSVPYGATIWFESIAPRWVRDHHPLYMQDHSVVNNPAGFWSVTDVLVRMGHGDSKEVVWTGEHVGQGIKLTLGGSSNYPAAASELATITGISHAQVWTPTGMKAETDPVICLIILPAEEPYLPRSAPPMVAINRQLRTPVGILEAHHVVSPKIHR